MKVVLTDVERSYARCKSSAVIGEAYIKVTVILLLDKHRLLASIADDLGLDETTVYRYARAFADLELAKYLVTSALATGACSPAPNSPASVTRSTRAFIPTPKPCKAGWPRAVACAIRRRA